jgi:N-acetylmuramoyl-L-alanine amidase
VTLGDKDDVLAHVLLDLSMDANRSASFDAGASMLAELSRVTKLHKRGVEQAGFVVLKAPDVPSILVETGYISNPAEARRLNTVEYQEQLAGAGQRRAPRTWKNMRHPARWWPGSAVRETSEYTIERGDTLSEIAVRYGISANRIREVNGLRGNVIRAGQTIVIPAG